MAGEPHTNNISSAPLDFCQLMRVLQPTGESEQAATHGLDGLIPLLAEPREQPARKVRLRGVRVVTPCTDAVGVQIEQRRVVVRSAICLVHVRVIVAVARIHIHPVIGDDVVCPNACEQRSRRVECGESKVGGDRCQHTPHGVLVEGDPRRTHLLGGGGSIGREGRLRTLVKQSAHGPLDYAYQRLLLGARQEAIAYDAATALQAAAFRFTAPIRRGAPCHLWRAEHVQPIIARDSPSEPLMALVSADDIPRLARAHARAYKFHLCVLRERLLLLAVVPRREFLL